MGRPPGKDHWRSQKDHWRSRKDHWRSRKDHWRSQKERWKPSRKGRTPKKITNEPEEIERRLIRVVPGPNAIRSPPLFILRSPNGMVRFFLTRLSGAKTWFEPLSACYAVASTLVLENSCQDHYHAVFNHPLSRNNDRTIK